MRTFAVVARWDNWLNTDVPAGAEPRRLGAITRARRYASVFVLVFGFWGITACSSSELETDGPPQCHPSVVLCTSPPPACPSGYVPATSGICWGKCVKASSCQRVKDCDACSSDDDVCVVNAFLGSVHVRCAEVPVPCAADRSCACLGPYVCTAGHGCNGGGENFSCDCPHCAAQ
jgi:hypothetical protein